MKIKVLTYNIQHGVDWNSPGHEINLDQIASIIKKTDADIVNLNEVYGAGGYPCAPDELTVSYLASLAGYNYSFFAPAIKANGKPYGNGFLSRFPIKYVEVIPIPDPLRKEEDVHYESRNIMRFILKAGDKLFTVFGSHFGVAKSEERNAVMLIEDLLSEEKNECICLGDFNVTPDNEIIKPLLTKLKNTSPGNEPTFPSYAPEIKIDYILVSEGIEVISGAPLKIIASDHFPYMAELEI